MTTDDRATVGLTPEMHEALRRLVDDKHLFAEMRDGYRFGIGLAIARGEIVPDGLSYETYLGINSLDPDGALKAMVIELFPECADRPYAWLQRLAEWGVREIATQADTGSIQISELIQDLTAE